MSMGYTQALEQKFKHVRKTVYDLTQKGYFFRAPKRLAWLHDYLYNSFSGINKPNPIPTGFIAPFTERNRPISPLKEKVARTFCALEDYEKWLEKAQKSFEKHSAEIVRQASNKITRIEAYMNLAEDDSDSDEDIPF